MAVRLVPWLGRVEHLVAGERARASGCQGDGRAEHIFDECRVPNLLRDGAGNPRRRGASAGREVCRAWNRIPFSRGRIAGRARETLCEPGHAGEGQDRE